jgi:hypothetical protein
MEIWRTTFQLQKNMGLMQSASNEINKGIFQGDSSPILLCKALISLTHELNKSKCWYQLHGNECKISHLLYMDHLNLIGRREEELRKEMRIVKTISNDMKLECVLGKCVKSFFKKWKSSYKKHIDKIENVIKELESTKGCKYLGVKQSHSIEDKREEEEKLKMERVRSLRLILKELSTKIKCKQLEHWQYQH